MSWFPAKFSVPRPSDSSKAIGLESESKSKLGLKKLELVKSLEIVDKVAVNL